MQIRLSLKFIIPLGIFLSLVTYITLPLVDQLTLKWFLKDLEIRTNLISNALKDPLINLLESKSYDKINKLFTDISKDERLYAVAFCDELENKIINKTNTLPDQVTCELAKNANENNELLFISPQGRIHVAFYPIQNEMGFRYGNLILVHDMSFIDRRSQTTKKYIFIFFLVLTSLVSLLTVIIAQLSWKGWVNGIRSVLKGEGLLKPITSIKSSPELRPIVKDLRELIQDIHSNRSARDEHQIKWDPKALKDILQRELAGDEVIIVSNRQPYIHVHKNDKIEIQFPASGLVTALEPIMRACSGTWVAHGNGSADKDVVDEKDHIKVPPGNPTYQIRRVWLTKDEENAYYYGFANEGLWPLCHIAHVRPIFRFSDFKAYKDVNQKFANAVIEEAKTDNPVILVQDYHFALLPKMIREKLPNATIITFWHIPWPNPEAFGICPWREEILDGLLGSSILGMHTRFHCNNFIETVDRFLESRIDYDASTISYRGSLTSISHYPISIEYPTKWAINQKSIKDSRSNIRKINNLPDEILLGIGVDRLDYTKGIIERFMAIERLFEMEPHWIGKFTFIQIAAPSRTSIDQYQHFESEVRSLAQKINKRFGIDGYLPICLKIEYHTPEQIHEYYRGSDVCFITSLHDGMNLVAKEFVAARDDELGVLILSRFTGAAKELPEALIVNPYDIDECAVALHLALEMPKEEQRGRMKMMRNLIQEFNVYRWGGRMLMDAARIRQQIKLKEKISKNNIKFDKR